jgi:hypothetical protein
VDLYKAGQTNRDFTFSIPSISDAQVLLATLAPEFGYDPTGDASRYNTRFRNVALAQLRAGWTRSAPS